MADNTIQLTPAELLSQASQLQSVYDQYSGLFTSVQSTLKNINTGLSSNLAHNFLGKITSAQNSFSRILQTIEGGIKVATSAANTFQSVDSELAKLLNGGSGNLTSTIVQEVAQKSGIDPKLLAGLSPDMLNTVTQAIANGDYSKLVDVFGNGLTGTLKNTAKDLLKNNLGINVNIDGLVDKFKKGDIAGGLLDVAGANINLFNSSGKVSKVDLALDFLRNTWKIVTKENGYATTQTEVYTDRILNGIQNGDFGDIATGLGGYLVDVPVRVLTDATAKTCSHVVDKGFKIFTGKTLTEINDSLYQKYGTSPGHIFNKVASGIGDKYHDFIKTVSNTDNVKKVVSSTFKSAASGIKSVGGGFAKAVKGFFS